MIIVLIVSISCKFDEFPEPDTTVDVTLNLDFDSELSLDVVVNHEQGTLSNASNYDVRHTINIYKDELSNNNFSRVPNSTIVKTYSITESLNQSITLELEQANYRFIVFTDYVNKGEIVDKFYRTNDFAEITWVDQQNYTANNDYKDSFKGEIIKELDESHSNITLSMQRPLSKFEVIATDFDVFVTNILEKSGLDSVNLDDYRVVFSYNGFMPSSFNLFSDRPADSWLGISFEGKIEKITESEARLGFDYAFVSPTASSVSVVIEVYDSLNNKKSHTGIIDIPIVRSKLTTIKGKFLTSIINGGIGLNTEFDGEYNYEVN